MAPFIPRRYRARIAGSRHLVHGRFKASGVKSHMNRSAVQENLNLFFGRAGCASIADCNIARAYLASLKGYIAQLQETFDPIDVWSVQELERATDYLFHNQRWISGSEQASLVLGDAFDAIDEHREFLAHHGLMPDYLRAPPNNSFKPESLHASAQFRHQAL